MTEDRDIDVPHETASFVAELRRLADALESGETFTIKMDDEDVTIPEDAYLSIAHERDGDEVELEFQITWSLAEDEDEDEPDDEEDADAEETASTPA